MIHQYRLVVKAKARGGDPFAVVNQPCYTE
jgi:hypothetical protein